MKSLLFTLLLIAAVLLSACATQRTVLCISPSGDFQPETGAGLLQEFNRQMPYTVSPRNFVCKAKSGRLVGWVVVKTEKQKDIAKERLYESSSLNCVQVETLTPQMARVIRENWRESQKKTVPDKTPE